MPHLPLLLALLLIAPAVLARDDDDDEPRAPIPPQIHPAPASTTPTNPTVHLTEARQKASGLQIAPLQAAQLQPEIAAFGKVLDVRPLLELRVRYRTARAETRVTGANLHLAEQTRRRLDALHKEDIIAGRELAHAEAEHSATQAKDEAARRLVGEIHREAEQAWGAELARRALDEDSALFDELLNHRRALVLVSLPAGQVMPKNSRGVHIGRDGEREKAQAGELLASAPLADDLVQGETYFAQVPASGLRAGMRVNAWIAAGGSGVGGVVVPKAAAVWHAGKPWIYRRSGAEDFERLPLENGRPLGGGWFVDHGLSPGDAVVVTGSQMLLSEELRGQIPDEDDD